MHLISEDVIYTDVMKSFGVDADVDEIELTAKVHEKIFPERKEEIARFKECINTMEQQLNDVLYRRFKICCFSTDYKNRLMWSHYADSHRGFCVEYDFTNYLEDKLCPMPVCYSNIRLKLPWEVILKQSQDRETIIHFVKVLLMKDEVWSYENEWRLVRFEELGDGNMPAPPIKCIYIGACCSEEDTKGLVEIAKELSVPVKKMVVDRGEYGLHPIEI